MLDRSKMKVSLTKNGAFKLPDVIRHHPGCEILDNVSGTYPGINLAKSQASKILGVDLDSGDVPSVWDEVRRLGNKAIDGCAFIALILSHSDLIDALAKNEQDVYRGILSRDDMPSDKAYTNFIYGMACLNLCAYEPGTVEVEYDFHPLVANLQGHKGRTVKKLIELKLKRAGWVDPTTAPLSGDREFFEECRALRLPQVFSMDPDQFDAWLRGDLTVEMPSREFGLNRHLASRGVL